MENRALLLSILSALVLQLMNNSLGLSECFIGPPHIERFAVLSKGIADRAVVRIDSFEQILGGIVVTMRLEPQIFGIALGSFNDFFQTGLGLNNYESRRNFW